VTQMSNQLQTISRFLWVDTQAEEAVKFYTSIFTGPHFKFTEAVSFVVNCESQEEVDNFWEKLSKGGQEVQCGWVKDEFGLSWQIVPTVLPKLLQDKDPERSKRVMHAMLQMKKLDIATLEKAHRG